MGHYHLTHCPRHDPTAILAWLLFLVPGLVLFGVWARGHGKLLRLGSLTRRAIAEEPDQTLSGNGTVIGSVNNRGTIAPGASIGTLTITGDAASTTDGRMWMEVDNATTTKDLLQVNGALTYDGTLIVTNVSATPYTAGQVLKLFNAGGYSGAFATIVLPGVSEYDATQLTVDGTLKVLSTIPTTPTELTFTVSDGELTISWPASYTGWRLETQANSLDVGLSDNWVTVPGSTEVNTMTFTIDPSQDAVFYRLVYP